MPNSFDNFVDMKYNNSRKYENLKDRYHIKTNKTFEKLHEGKQDKHILGTSNFNTELRQGRLKSLFFYNITNDNLREILEKYKGTGELDVIINKSNGKKIYREVIKVENEIANIFGIDKTANEEEKYYLRGQTRVITIHYSNTGAHLVPKWEE